MGCTSSIDARLAMEGNASAEVLPGSRDFFASYSLGPKLGQGSFAQVRVALRNDSIEEVAVKILDLREAQPDQAERKSKISQKKWGLLNREIEVWSSIKVHPNIVQLHDVFLCPDVCMIVMEKCGSSLLHHMEAQEVLDERTLGKIFSQMLRGIAHLQDGRVAHRDIKPDNFLVANDGLTIKLCDFGLSVALPESGRLDGLVGSAPFMCPEMLKNKGYDEKADVWSFGVLAYALLFGVFPYMPAGAKEDSTEAMHKAIVKGVTPTFEPARKSDTFRTRCAITFVKTLLTRNPTQRPSSRDALHMSYVVLTKEDKFMVADELPSLRPMLRPCKKIGAFEIRNLWRATQTDLLVENYHQRRTGTSIRDSWAPKLSTERCDTRKKTEEPKDSTTSTGDTHSGSTSASSSKDYESSKSSKGTHTWEVASSTQSGTQSGMLSF